MKTPRRLTQNALFLPEEDLYLKSAHVHDYVTHTLADGVEVMIDGGLDYIRHSVHRGAEAARVVDWCLYDDSSWEAIAEGLLWGTYGKEGKGPLRYRPISTLELDHLRAILKTQDHIDRTLHQKVVCHWFIKKGGKL